MALLRRSMHMLFLRRPAAITLLLLALTLLTRAVALRILGTGALSGGVTNAPTPDAGQNSYPVAQAGYSSATVGFSSATLAAPASMLAPGRPARHLRGDYVIAPPDVLEVAIESNSALQPMLQSAVGQHVVKPDGALPLGDFEPLMVDGRTLDEVCGMILETLAPPADCTVTVSVASQNSKVYYVILENSGGDSICRFPSDGNETVRFALSQINEIPPAQFRNKAVWIARPGAVGFDEVLPINVAGVLDGVDQKSNFVLEPGDRVFIASEPGFWSKAVLHAIELWQGLSQFF